MFREAIAKACVQDFGHTMVVECDSGEEAIRAVVKSRPDVLIMDLSLPDLDGFTVIDQDPGALSLFRRLHRFPCGESERPRFRGQATGRDRGVEEGAARARGGWDVFLARV